ncbi:sensor histidine kinase [Hymenobacter humi]|uniref:histidine kinase n=1 Tax=Hymenobacter humi TaxID=1411620 RepID=A0ABW2U7Y0_9BACT
MLTTDFDPHLGLVKVVSSDIRRVLINLFTNALYALAQRKHQLGSDYTPQLRVVTKRRAKYIEIRVRDNGPGMSPEVQQKVFQPFFTTKPPGEGTGLGLSLSHDIVATGHGGTLTVASEEGKYAEFCLALPVK